MPTPTTTIHQISWNRSQETSPTNTFICSCECVYVNHLTKSACKWYLYAEGRANHEVNQWSQHSKMFGCAIVWWAFVVVTWMCGGRRNKTQDGRGRNSKSCSSLFQQVIGLYCQGNSILETLPLSEQPDLWQNVCYISPINPMDRDVTAFVFHHYKCSYKENIRMQVWFQSTKDGSECGGLLLPWMISCHDVPPYTHRMN